MKKFTLGENTAVEIIPYCIDILENHGVILLPTETVYGLVCKFEDTDAEEKIYRLKHRPAEKRLSVFVDNAEKLMPYQVKFSSTVKELAQMYCPGAVTIIAERGNDSSLGFRIPDHEFVLELLRQVPFPLSSTSANRSGMPNVLDVDEALSELDGAPDIVIDGGRLSETALASTVVDARNSKVKILRQGALIIADKFLL